MKKLSDYKDDDAILLWGDLFEPVMKILASPAVAEAMKTGNLIKIAQAFLKDNVKEAKECLLLIDDTPIDGINMMTRLVSFIGDLVQSEEFGSFFKSAEPEKTENVSSGSAMVSTEEKGK